MTNLEHFYNVARENKHLTAIFEQMGYYMDCFKDDDFRDIVLTAQNICKHGIAGGYSGFIYYSETEEFFKAHADLILDFIEDTFTLDEFLDLIEDKLDIRDILVRTPEASNFYVWLYVESVLNSFYDDIEDALSGE